MYRKARGEQRRDKNGLVLYCFCRLSGGCFGKIRIQKIEGKRPIWQQSPYVFRRRREVFAAVKDSGVQCSCLHFKLSSKPCEQSGFVARGVSQVAAIQHPSYHSTDILIKFLVSSYCNQTRFHWIKSCCSCHHVPQYFRRESPVIS